MHNLECELKYLLNYKDYIKFCDYMTNNSKLINVKKHVNYYLDTEDLKLNKSATRCNIKSIT